MASSQSSLLGILFLLAGVACFAIGLATNHWYYELYGGKIGDFGGSIVIRHGLLQKCTYKLDIKTPFLQLGREIGDKVCTFDAVSFKKKFEALQNTDNFFKELDQRNNYQLITFGLIVFAAASGILGLLMTPCCCEKCGGWLVCVLSLGLIAGLGGIGLYAYYTKELRENSDLSWSFWTSLGGVGAYLLSIIFFGVPRAQQYSTTPETYELSYVL